MPGARGKSPSKAATTNAAANNKENVDDNNIIINNNNNNNNGNKKKDKKEGAAPVSTQKLITAEQLAAVSKGSKFKFKCSCCAAT